MTVKRYTVNGVIRNLDDETAKILGLDPKDGVERRREFRAPSEIHVAGKPPTSSTGVISSGTVTSVKKKERVRPVDTTEEPVEKSSENEHDETEETETEETSGGEDVTGDDETTTEETETSTDADNKAETSTDAPNKARRTRSRS